MFKKHRTEVIQRKSHGLRSQIFLQQGDLPGANLAITWVDVPPEVRQMLHLPRPEQVSVILAGTGRMHVGEEEEDVGTGDLISIPPMWCMPLKIAHKRCSALVRQPLLPSISLPPTGEPRARGWFLMQRRFALPAHLPLFP